MLYTVVLGSISNVLSSRGTLMRGMTSGTRIQRQMEQPPQPGIDRKITWMQWPSFMRQSELDIGEFGALTFSTEID
jgi:hypothetical protein